MGETMEMILEGVNCAMCAIYIGDDSDDGVELVFPAYCDECECEIERTASLDIKLTTGFQTREFTVKFRWRWPFVTFTVFDLHPNPRPSQLIEVREQLVKVYGEGADEK